MAHTYNLRKRKPKRTDPLLMAIYDVLPDDLLRVIAFRVSHSGTFSSSNQRKLDLLSMIRSRRESGAEISAGPVARAATRQRPQG